MEELKIEWHTDGFVKDAKYTFHLQSVLESFRQKFPGVQKLVVNIHEEPMGIPSYKGNQKSVIISDDKLVITINQGVRKYCNAKGKVTSTPEPFEVFDGLRFLLNSAIEDYKNLSK